MNRSDRRSHGKKRRAPLALIVVPAVLIGAGVVLVLLLTGGGKAIIDQVIPGGDEPVPAFDFKLAKVAVIATTEDADVDALRPLADGAVNDVAPVLDTLFTAAFLDPNNWKDGEYAEAFEQFSDASIDTAQLHGIDTLTLGANAGDLYDAVTPNKGSIRFEVLFDNDGNPFSVAAHVRFYATAERKDGTFVAIVSHGVMFVRDSGSGWKVQAYDMKRNDHETEAPSASTGSSATPSAETGSTGGTGAS